ncbi:unnamed protein product [Miscanthus lutarioriparius]|uniref:J domain-containing protein n=1 Tax=Miscanthus lutarioriparius TaxID=422564 RepID=A0A811M736_9POAL|nr:unnamed protein product [Miscanthus lutarioriparius]
MAATGRNAAGRAQLKQLRQHVTVGVVGGSDLVKITEQLGKTGDEHRRSIIALMMNSATLEVLGVEKTASQQEIKKTYHKLALRLHPECFFTEAKEKFQQLQKVISILGDSEKRALYDQTGITDDDVRISFVALQFYL